MLPITIPAIDVVPVTIPDIESLPIHVVDLKVTSIWDSEMIPLHVLDIGEIPILLVPTTEKYVKLIDPIKEPEKYGNNNDDNKAVEHHFQHYKNKSVWWVVYCLGIAILASYMTYNVLTTTVREGFSEAVNKFDGYRYMHIKAPVVILYLYFRS
jgi:hypothetical protein